MQINQPTASKVTAFRNDYTKLFGIKAAIVLHQIHYWTDPARCKNNKEGRYWVYNSSKEWQQHFEGLSERTLRRIFKYLEDVNVIITKRFNAWRRDQRKWYTINFEKLGEMLQTLKQVSSRGRQATKDDPPPKPRPEKDVKTDQKELILVNENMRLSAESKNENGGNLDVAKTDECTSGQNGRMSKVQKITQKITSPTSQSQQPQNTIQDLTREMIKIWDKNIEDKPETTLLTYWRRRTLQKTLKQSFQNSLEQWTQYCRIIAHNTFLMGQGPNQWKISLDWALKPQNIQKVQEKRYTGQKDIPSDTRSSSFSLDSLTGSNDWKNICKILVTRLGHDTFWSWFEEAELAEEMTPHPTLYLGTNFKKSWVSQRFGHTVEASIKEVLSHVQFLSFKVKNECLR